MGTARTGLTTHCRIRHWFGAEPSPGLCRERGRHPVKHRVVSTGVDKAPGAGLLPVRDGDRNLNLGPVDDASHGAAVLQLERIRTPIEDRNHLSGPAPGY